MKKKTNNKGFTLIELVIVLAIAALILVGVLLAVSGAQKSRRDQQRKSNLDTMLANAETYESNHAGALPPAVVNIDSSMSDPSTNVAYDTIAAGTAGYTQLFPGTTAGTKACNGVTALNATQVKVTMLLESGDTACVDDH